MQIMRSNLELNTKWLTLDGSLCGMGWIYNWAIDTQSNTLWYQTQGDCALCALDMNAMTARHYGNYRCLGAEAGVGSTSEN
jgi:hypothetical protein